MAPAALYAAESHSAGGASWNHPIKRLPTQRRRKVRSFKRSIFVVGVLGALRLLVATGVSFTSTNGESSTIISAGAANYGDVYASS